MPGLKDNKLLFISFIGLWRKFVSKRKEIQFYINQQNDNR